MLTDQQSIFYEKKIASFRIVKFNFGNMEKIMVIFNYTDFYSIAGASLRNCLPYCKHLDIKLIYHMMSRMRV